MMSDLFFTGPRELLPYDGSAILHDAVWALDESHELLVDMVEHVEWVQPKLLMFGRPVLQPRLTAWFGDPDRRYSYSGVAFDPKPWTDSLRKIKAVCEERASACFNSVLVNLYRSGDDSVAWHADDEPELGPNPIIASVSLGATRRFDLKHRETGETVKTDLRSGSLLVMSGACQHKWVHQVAKTKKVNDPRVNLTFRSIHV